jgi:BirA family transcriptional regulator, biotin operon repressor / biotin---[acetyl-CoA-carboxylase] ligase
MSFARAKAALTGSRFADLRWVAETGSTNADMAGLVAGAEPAAAPLVLVSDHQTAGRGRLDRTWQAPPGSSVLMTIAVPVGAIPESRRTLLSTALALAVHAVRPELSVKWPNDLVVPAPEDDPLGYRKVGGILAEAINGPGDTDWVLLGIGLNVNWPAVPDELEGIAASLNDVVGHELDREDLVASVLRRFDEEWLPLVEAGDIDGLLAAYRRCSATLGRRVLVQLPAGEIVGTATAVTDEGALVVEDGAGTTRTVTVGDIVHLRSAP